MPTLIDGREVDSASPEWRIETLARAVLKKPLAERREWLADFEKKNPSAAAALRDVIVAVHTHLKESKT